MREVLVVGATGMLGYHATTELVRRGYAVTGVALPEPGAAQLFPTGVELVLEDLNAMSDGQLANLLAGKHAVVYAAGFDDRVVPDSPAAHFFYEVNVRPVQRVVRVARATRVSRFVLYGSHTVEWGEVWPELGFRTRNGYPRTRFVQEEVAVLEGEGSMTVTVLRLPYVFGTTPNRPSLWQVFVDRVAAQQGDVVVQGGSTSSVTVRQVAQATVGAIERGVHGGRYSINGYDLSYAELHRVICGELGRDPGDVVVVPLESQLASMERYDMATASMGKEHGIHMADAVRFQDRHACTPTRLTQDVLGYEDDNVPAAITATVRECVARRAGRGA